MSVFEGRSHDETSETDHRLVKTTPNPSATKNSSDDWFPLLLFELSPEEPLLTRLGGSVSVVVGEAELDVGRGGTLVLDGAVEKGSAREVGETMLVRAVSTACLATMRAAARTSELRNAMSPNGGFTAQGLM